MKMLATLILAALLCLPGNAQTQRVWIFRGDYQTAGYFIGGLDGGSGRLWVEGLPFRLAGLDVEQYGWHLRDDWHSVLIIGIVDPWVVGRVQWKGATGIVDFLSTDWQHDDIPIVVENVVAW